MNHESYTGQYILDAEGKPVAEPDLLKWAEWMGITDRHIANDMIFGVNISTIFLGVDFSAFFGTPPMLWETMIFGGRYSYYQERYISREDAIEGHAKAVAMVRGVTVN